MIKSIRLLPNDPDHGMHNEVEFKYFIEHTMMKRKGVYYFPTKGMDSPEGALVLFQYNSKIRAVGIILEMKKEPCKDETGKKYGGWFRFDTGSLCHLDNPISAEAIKKILPDIPKYKNFRFSPTKWEIPLSCLDSIMTLLASESPDISVDNNKDYALDVEQELDGFNLLGKDREAVVRQRVNQHKFRDLLLGRYACKCCLCGISGKEFLVASHIKPWAACKDTEKLDVNNGLLMCPNHDKLFDQGWISFQQDGRIMISDSLDETNRIFFNVHPGMTIKTAASNEKYLNFHRTSIFLDDNNVDN